MLTVKSLQLTYFCLHLDCSWFRWYWLCVSSSDKDTSLRDGLLVFFFVILPLLALGAFIFVRRNALLRQLGLSRRKRSQGYQWVTNKHTLRIFTQHEDGVLFLSVSIVVVLSSEYHKCCFFTEIWRGRIVNKYSGGNLCLSNDEKNLKQEITNCKMAVR